MGSDRQHMELKDFAETILYGSNLVDKLFSLRVFQI